MYTSAVAKALHKKGPVEVGVRELRANLSRWIDRVRKGQEVIVTDRGSPVAKLTAYPQDDPLERLVAMGIAERPKAPKTPIDRKRLIKAEGWSLSDIVIQEREEEHAELLRQFGVREAPEGRSRER